MSPLIVLLVLSNPSALTFTCAATPAKQVVETLAAKSGQKLRVSPKLGAKFVVARLVEAPVDETLERLAKALEAKWVSSGGERILQPLPVVEGSSDRQAWTEAVRKYLAMEKVQSEWTMAHADDLVAKGLEVGRLGVDSPGYSKQSNGILLQDPQRRLLRRVVSALGEKTIVDLPVGKRLVFAMTPTKMQRQLPNGVLSALEQYGRESRLQNAALEKKGFTQETQPNFGYEMPVIHFSWLADKKIDKILLILKKSRRDLVIDLELVVKNSGVESIYDSVSTNQRPPPDDKPLLQFDGVYKPSVESSMLARAFLGASGNPIRDPKFTAKESEHVLKFFSDLEQNELLSFAPSEIVLQSAQALGKNVIVCLDDSAVDYFFYPFRNTQLNLASYFTSRWQTWSPTLDGSWLDLAAPTVEAFNHGLSLPRRAMSKFVKEVAKSGLTIDSLADLVLAVPDNELAASTVMYSLIPFPGRYRQIGGLTDRSVLRLYAMLDPGGRSKAKNGGYNIPFRALPPVLQRGVSDYLYDTRPMLPTDPPKLDDSSVESDAMDIESDATSRLPNGLPADCAVSFRVRTLDRMFTILGYSGGSSHVQVQDEDSAAGQMAWTEKAIGTKWGPSSAKLAVNKLEQLDMMILLGPTGAHGRHQLLPLLKPKDLVDPDGLPNAMKASFKTKLDKAREAMKNVKVGEGPGRIKP